MKQSHVSPEAAVRFFFVLLLLLAPALAHAAAQTATINNAEISYEVCGAEGAQGVVLIHDGLANSATWDDAWPLLCERYRVVRYDRRGYGKSPPAKRQHAPSDDLWGVMQHVGLSHAHLIGASVGAGIAIDFLFDHPEAVDKLVLVAPAVSGFNTHPEFVARLQALEEHIRAGDMDATIAAINADPHFFGAGDKIGRAKLAEILKASPWDLGAHPNQMRPFNTAARLGEVYAPAMIVVGSTDHEYNLAIAGAMQKAMRNTRLHAMLGAGQLLYMDNGAAFAGLVIQFLE